LKEKAASPVVTDDAASSALYLPHHPPHFYLRTIQMIKPSISNRRAGSIRRRGGALLGLFLFVETLAGKESK